MNVSVIRHRLQEMINEQEDKKVLEAIYTLLQKTGLNPILKEKLSKRAKKAEEDITENRTFTKEEVIEKTNQPG